MLWLGLVVSDVRGKVGHHKIGISWGRKKRERKSGFTKFDITTVEKFLSLQIIKFVNFLTSGLSNKDITFGTGSNL